MFLAARNITKSGTRSKAHSERRRHFAALRNAAECDSSRSPRRGEKFRRYASPQEYFAADRLWGIPHVARRERLRQDYTLTTDRRFRAAHLRRNLDEQRASGHAPALQAPREHRLPKLCALSAPERPRKRRLRVARQVHPEGGNRRPCRRSSPHGQNGAV